MPAPLAKGELSSCIYPVRLHISPRSSRYAPLSFPSPPQSLHQPIHTPSVLLFPSSIVLLRGSLINPPGLIIAASVLVAAGIAIYESPQVRQWVDQSRRKIAIALHSLGDDIHPRRSSECSDDYEARQERREEIIRRNRNELIRRAREEGIAVDLDELARIGREDVEMTERRQRRKTNASSRSFDDIVSSDGTLKVEDAATKTVTGIETNDTGLRKRGPTGFESGAAIANPFADETLVLFDHDTDEASSKLSANVESRESSATAQGDHPSAPPSTSGQLIDLTSESLPQPENPQTASVPQSEAGDDNDPVAQSFYSFASSLRNSTHEFELQDDDMEQVSTGTLTPRSDRSAFTGASVAGSYADDVAVLSVAGDDDHDARSEIFSEGGFTEAGFSEAGFSEVGSRTGAMTPADWTDVGSDDESEWGGPAQGGHVSQMHQ